MSSITGGLAAGVAADHTDAVAVAAEGLPIFQPCDGLHPPGDLALRQPEHLHLTTNFRRPDGGKGRHGSGGDGDGGPWASASVLERTTEIRPKLSSPSSD